MWSVTIEWKPHDCIRQCFRGVAQCSCWLSAWIISSFECVLVTSWDANSYKPVYVLNAVERSLAKLTTKSTADSTVVSSVACQCLLWEGVVLAVSGCSVHSMKSSQVAASVLLVIWLASLFLPPSSPSTTINSVLWWVPVIAWDFWLVDKDCQLWEWYLVLGLAARGGPLISQAPNSQKFSDAGVNSPEHYRLWYHFQSDFQN